MWPLFFVYLLFCYVFLSRSFSSSFEHHLCSPSEASALLQFKKSFQNSKYFGSEDSDYPKTISWNESRDCCTWDRVTGDMLTGYVVVLDLSRNRLSGTIHPNSSLFQLHHLQTLNLANNDFNDSSILHNIGRLTNLRFSRNNFSKSIPSCLGSMANLTGLDLRRNSFIGSLPPLCAQSNSLRTIILNDNRLEGPVPMSLLKCDDLEIFDVENNAINDTFPAWLRNLQVLQVLILKSNKFHGPISSRQTFGFPRLQIFYLSHNEFSGSLPAEIFQNFKVMTKLAKGEIEYMKPLFFGMIDYSLSIDDQVIEQKIVGNEVYEDSVTLMIKGNDMELKIIRTIVPVIDLSSSHFEGVIPKTLMDLGLLWLLNLSHNNLEGDIPV